MTSFLLLGNLPLYLVTYRTQSLHVASSNIPYTYTHTHTHTHTYMLIKYSFEDLESHRAGINLNWISHHYNSCVNHQSARSHSPNWKLWEVTIRHYIFKHKSSHKLQATMESTEYQATLRQHQLERCCLCCHQLQCIKVPQGAVLNKWPCLIDVN